MESRISLSLLYGDESRVASFSGKDTKLNLAICEQSINVLKKLRNLGKTFMLDHCLKNIEKSPTISFS